jgi:heptosyltransferase-1
MPENGDNSTAEPPKRVLIVLLGAIGDVVRALPLLNRVRRAWPHAHIAWAVEPKSLPILEGHPWLDELIVYDRRHAPWSFFGFLRAVRRGRFDITLDLQRHLKSGIASRMSGAPERLGFAAPNTKEFNHLFSTRTIAPQPSMRLKLSQYLAFADALALPPAPVEFGLSPTPEEINRVRAMLRDTPRHRMAVILGSSWPSRVYFAESIAATIRLLAQPSYGSLFPLLLGAPEEMALAAAVTAHLDVPALNLAGRTSLRDLFAIFRETVVAFGPDCGPMHIAAAIGCPVVSLWGATAPQRSAPWGFGHLAIAADIPCHPCYLRECPVGRECMRRIAPEDVAAMVRRAVEAREASGTFESRDAPSNTGDEKISVAGGGR